jgi:hypothetical protein
MVRVKAGNILRNIDFDKCLNTDSMKGSVSTLTNQFAIQNKRRSGLRVLCDNKKNKSIFRDLSKTLDTIETERLNEEGPLLTSKLEGISTSSISRKNNPEMERGDIDQIGGGRKRKYVHHDKKKKSLDGYSKKRRVGKKRGRKKSRKAKHHRRRGAVSRKSSTKRRKKRSGKKRRRKHHFKKHNIFSTD